ASGGSGGPAPAGTGGATKPSNGGATPAGTGGAATGGSTPAQTGGAVGTGGGVASGGAAGGSTTGTGGAGGPDAGAPGVDSGAVDPGTAGDGDFMITAGTTQPDLTDRGAPKGKRFTFVMDSTKSAIFNGSDKTVNASERELTRQISVYVPAQYKDGTPAPILVMQDGPPVAPGWGDGPPFDAVSRALDNLTISTDPARKIPAFIAIGVQNGGSDAQGSERGLEYDTLSDRYARFVQMEVLPAVLANAQIKAAYPKISITDDPEGKGTYGCSSGAAASFTMAWFRPDLFRRVITYSGTFVAQQGSGQPESTMYPLGAWEYHSSLALISKADPPKPLRVHLNVNEKDNGYTAAESGHHNWVLANQHMAAALKTKGYHYKFNFVKALGHCDYNAWRATLADTLIWLWKGYPN
ncbi:MAG: alpha/beta hydrolase-fold protein, partial [Verrucomicrobiota bacterium]